MSRMPAGRYLIALEVEEHSLLKFALGIAYGSAIQAGDSVTSHAISKLANRINAGDAEWKPHKAENPRPQQQNNKPLLTLKETALSLSVNTARAAELVRTGALPKQCVVRLGRQIRIEPDAFDEFLKSGGKPLEGGWRREPKV